MKDIEKFRDEITRYDTKALEKRGYKINPRKFGDIWKILGKSKLVKRKEFDIKDDKEVYSGAEYTKTPKLPNITVLPDLWIGMDQLHGSSLGHQHTQSEKGDKRLFQEIYEFLGYGAMLLRNENSTNLYVLKPREKVIVGTGDNMTLFNLDYKPLVTIDMANPQMNSANKDLENEVGPLMIMKHMEFSEANTTLFKINEEYIKRKLLKCDEAIRQNGLCSFGSVKIEGEESKFLIGIGDTGQGQELYNSLRPREFTEENKREYESLKDQGLGCTAGFYLDGFQNYHGMLKKLGINVIHGGNIPRELEKEFSPSLLELAVSQDKTLMEILNLPKKE
ncbi:MAG: hypothetical protein WCP89_00090 [archaeon]